MPAHDPVQHGWQVHQAVLTWTNQSETKASLLLPLQSALFVFFGQRVLAGDLPEEAQIADTTWLRVLFVVGLGGLFVGTACLLLVVLPRLRDKTAKRLAPQNAIYFGHLRHNDWSDIKDLLKSPDVLDQLARQLKVTSEIAYTKHRFLQVSMLSGAFGVLFIVFCYCYAVFW